MNSASKYLAPIENLKKKIEGERERTLKSEEERVGNLEEDFLTEEVFMLLVAWHENHERVRSHTHTHTGVFEILVLTERERVCVYVCER